MIVVDTTVLVYAVGSEHALREPCRDVVRAAGSGGIQATTTVEVIQEFVHVRARRRNRSDAAALGRNYLRLLSPLITPEGGDLRAALDLFEGRHGLGAFDAVLAATARRRSASAIVSADTG